MPDYITKTVRLAAVTREDGQTALDQMEDIFDEYGLPDEARQSLWEIYQVFASDVLIRLGEFDPRWDIPNRMGIAEWLFLAEVGRCWQILCRNCGSKYALPMWLSSTGLTRPS